MVNRVEIGVEQLLFASRWLLAPFYVGMTLALAAILAVFAHQLWGGLRHIAEMDCEQVIVLSLSLVDLSLTGNLLLIVIFAGYENFVSKLHIGEHEDRPSWMGVVNFAGLKLRLIASIIAISAIALLRAFLPLGEPEAHVDVTRLRWMVITHLAFVVSGVLLAAMDWIAARGEPRH